MRTSQLLIATLVVICLTALEIDASAKIAAFNIQVLGETKMGKPDVVDVLVDIIARYDMVLIQEIRNKNGEAIVQLLDEVNSYTNNQYKKIVGPRVGRSSSKEQYAYFYKDSMFSVVSNYTYPDTHDVFEREPFVVLFASPYTSVTEFSVIGLHAKPDDAVAEIDELTTVYNDMLLRWGNENSIIMGDLNADCSYVRSSEWSQISLKTDSRFKWLIDDYADTTVKDTDCAYDRIVLAGNDLKNTHSYGRIFNFHTLYGLTKDFAEDVSDHYPVDFDLY